MRKFMTKEVRVTTIKAGKIVVVDNVPTVETLPEIIILGNMSMEKAQKRVFKDYGIGATIFGLETESRTYKMEVEKFIEFATLVSDGEEVDEDEDEDEEEEESSSDVAEEPAPTKPKSRGKKIVVSEE